MKFSLGQASGGAQRWRIALETNFWLSSPEGDKPLATQPTVFFSDFACRAGSPSLMRERIAAGRIASTLKHVFEESLLLADPTAKEFEAEFDKDLVWRLHAVGPGGLRAFDNQALIRDFVFGWHRFDDHDVVFAGAADLMQGEHLPTVLVLGDPHGHRVEACLSPQEGHARPHAFEARVGVSPFDPKKTQSFTSLDLDAALLSIKDAKGILAGEVVASSLKLTQTRLPTGSHAIRTALWGNAFLAKDPKQPAEPDRARRDEIVSPIGRLIVGAPPVETTQSVDGSAVAQKGPTETFVPLPKDCANSWDRNKSEGVDRQARELIMQAASGDQGGARDASVWVVHDHPRPDAKKAPRGLRRVLLDLSLLGANVSPPDVSFSELTFAEGGSDLRLVYEDGEPFSELKSGEYPRARPSSFIWVGPRPDTHRTSRGEIDLSRATLTVARDYDLMKLRFRFLDLVLAFAPETAPTIRPAHAGCRLIETQEGIFEDNRPILVAEFDPQHVMEEAVFRPEPPPFPDVDTGKSDAKCEGLSLGRDDVLAKLAEYKGKPDQLVKYRNCVTAAKVEIEKIEIEKNKGKKFFADFSTAYGKAAAAARLPLDQQIYIGPFGLDPDAMAVARGVREAQIKDSIKAVVDAMFDRLNRTVFDSLLKAEKNPGKAGSTAVAQDSDSQFRAALEREARLEQMEPLYGLFRDFYREQATRACLDTQPDASAVCPSSGTTSSMNLTERDVEYLLQRNWPEGYTPSLKQCAKRDEVTKTFYDSALGADYIPNQVGARLAGLSRLAFRINCQPPTGTTAEDGGLPFGSGAGPDAPSGGGVTYEPIPYTFDALTDWSRHEPAVTLRARKLFTALPSGLVPPIGNRAANLSDHDILTFQGLSKGVVTAEQRLSEVRASMARKPNAFETAIEIPSRLILSTAQDAVWQTERSLPSEVLFSSGCKSIPVSPTSTPPILVSGRDLLCPCETIEFSRFGLWAARLATEDVNPGLRVVDTPDFRPMALTVKPKHDEPSQKGHNSPPALPGQGSPPRGPVAPWFIGPEEMEALTLTAEAVDQSLKKAPPQTDPALAAPAPTGAARDTRLRLIRWLCERAFIRKATPSELRVFRTSLDAYDRHQLLLLSSAFGLPVTGRRQQVGDDVEVGGALVAQSGQIEPGDEFAVIDGRDDQAIYRPIPLVVRELSLTALGGTFRHDTPFKPSAGADDLWASKLFEGFSIERWQQDIVLGRDVRSEVVYKGYLFPLGHRASMIKLTERIFLLTPNQGVKAMLRQRIFLEIGAPEKRFPALGQPHGGRLWCAQTVTLRTTRTPDILDPTASLGPLVNGETSNGKIDLGGNAGLAFWPRTDITKQGIVKFEFLLDGNSVGLPLIFIDNVGATTPASLAALVHHYRDEETLPRRKLSMNGQRVRYAPERQSGDTLLATEEIVISAHGRLASAGPNWEGDLTLFQTTGVLEGAEQPPFYPMMDHAVCRLDQVERFAGGAYKPVDVQFDGHYIRHGFTVVGAATCGDATASPPNPLEVYLNLRNIVKLDMGTAGDRSAAIGRPNSKIVALSRLKGPLGGDDTIHYEKPGAINPGACSSDYDPVETKNAGDGTQLIDPKKLSGLRSLASFYDQKRSNIAAPAATAATTATPTATAPAPASAPAPDVAKTLSILKAYFSGDAKVLGTITIKQLLELLDLQSPFDAVPELRETVEYGTAALRSGEQAAADIATDVRTRIIAPLVAIVGRLRAEWNALDAELLKRQRAVLKQNTQSAAGASAISLATLYPEIENGLRDLETSLAAAQAAADPLQLSTHLAILYEAGRRFMRVLATASSEAVDRLKESANQAIQNALANVLASFSGDFDSLSGLAVQLNTMLSGRRDQVAVEVVKQWIIRQLSISCPVGAQVDPDPVPIVDQLSLRLAPPDLRAIATSLGVYDGATKTGVDQIANKLQQSLSLSACAMLDAIVNSAVTEILNGNANPASLEDVTTNAVRAYLNTASAGFRDAISKARRSIEHELGSAANAKLMAMWSLADEELFEFERRMNSSIDDATGAQTYPTEFLLIVSAVKRVMEIFDRLRAVYVAVSTGKPKAALSTLYSFSSVVFGIGPTLQGQLAIDAQFAGFVGDLKNRSTFLRGAAYDPTLFAAEIAACSKFRANSSADLPIDKPSGEPINQIANALDKLHTISDLVGKAGDLLRSNKDAIRTLTGDATQYVALVTFNDNVGTLIGSAPPSTTGLVAGMLARIGALIGGAPPTSSTGLIADMRKLYCETVFALARLRAMSSIIDGLQSSKLDLEALGSISQLARALGQSSREIGAVLTSIVKKLTDFLNVGSNRSMVGAGATLLGGAGAVIAKDGRFTAIKTDFQKVADKGQAAEALAVAALIPVVQFALGFVTEGAILSDGIVDKISGAVIAADATIKSAGLDLDPEASEFIASLLALKTHIDERANYRGFPPQPLPVTFRDLLATSVVAGVTIQSAFTDGPDAKPYTQVASTSRNLEMRVLAEWRALQMRVVGLPKELKTAIEDQAFSSDLFGALVRGYTSLKAARLDALKQINGVPLLSASARHTLLVADYYGGTCNIDDDHSDLSTLADCDRLSEELKVLGAMTRSPHAQDQDRVNFLKFLGSWKTEQAAPLIIALHVRDVVAQALRGDILSLIDVAGFRDAIEDAIAQLIPTRATLSYDFDREFSKPDAEQKDKIFQAKQGSRFSLSVRAVVDLLAPNKMNFRANGYLGPFAINLVGDLIKALTLRFGGAAFEFVDGSKPRLDVKYQSYEIGKDLEFAKQLEDYLTPKDGSGIILTPLTRTVGIEAGYGINLGIIGVGETSFFNVVLNVSAELPFSDSEALFKTSLGRPLAPFTMSVVPFAGAGYFSIYSAANGIRGFEASFEFGGGGAIGFGLLQAQARIMVGLFVRMLKVDNVNSTEVYGTFFAGGSASIWIFSFATSLYVRLGQSNGGDMYGEAIYSFSFSLGIVDYDYSITVSKNQPQLLSNKGDPSAGGQRTELYDPADRIMFARADDGNTATDADPIRPGAHPKAKDKPRRELTATPDVVSRGVCQSKDWVTYASYFDANLLPEEAFQ